MHYLPFLLLLASCIRLLSLLLIRVFRWLIQTLRNHFPAFDRWIESRLNPVVQQFRKAVGSALLGILGLLLLLLFLIIHKCLYIVWQGLYFRDRREANNPETNPERLRKLGEGRNPITRKAIASNPNTPPDLLLKLGEQFPRQLLTNPVFELLLLEDPNLLKTMPTATLKSLLRLKEIPVGFLEQSASHYAADAELMQVIANHPKTPKYILARIAQPN